MHAVGSVGKDLSSRLVPRCTGVEGIRRVRSGNNGISTCRGSVIVIDNLTVVNSYDPISSGRVSRNAGRGASRNHRIVDLDLTAGSGFNTNVVNSNLSEINSNLHGRKHRVGGANSNAVVLLKNGVEHVNRSLGRLVQCYIEAVGCEPEDNAVFYVQVFSRKKSNTVDSAVAASDNTVDPQIAQDHNIARTGLDDYSVRTCNQN